MTNKQKTLQRDRVRLRKSHNSQQVDFKKMDKIRTVKTEFWKLKKRSRFVKKVDAKADTKKVKPEKEKKKKDKEPELEVVEDTPELEIFEEEPEIEEIDEELEDLYTYDEDLDDETEEDEVEEN